MLLGLLRAFYIYQLIHLPHAESLTLPSKTFQLNMNLYCLLLSSPKSAIKFNFELVLLESKQAVGDLQTVLEAGHASVFFSIRQS